jgi:hypothetical protein
MPRELLKIFVFLPINYLISEVIVNLRYIEKYRRAKNDIYAGCDQKGTVFKADLSDTHQVPLLLSFRQTQEAVAFSCMC